MVYFTNPPPPRSSPPLSRRKICICAPLDKEGLGRFAVILRWSRRMYSTNPPPLRGPPPLSRRKDTPLTKGDAEGRGICYSYKKFLFQKNAIYNIMSYITFWHQKNLKNLNSQLRYLSIFIKKFTTIVNFTISVKNWHLFSKNSLFHRKCEKICKKNFLDYT